MLKEPIEMNSANNLREAGSGSLPSQASDETVAPIPGSQPDIMELSPARTPDPQKL